MTKNPIFNALSAFLYILLVVSVMTFVTKPLRNTPDTFFAPVVFLTMFTLSVAVMAFLFFYQPLKLFIDKKQQEAVDLFVKTVGVFAFLAATCLLLLYLRVI